MKLPVKIAALIGNEAYTADSVGRSDSAVLLFQNQVLKVRKYDREARQEVRMLRWLKDRLPVPAVLAHQVLDGQSYLLLEKCPGRMACSEGYMSDPKKQAALLAEALKALWAVDITDCPCDQTLMQKLKQARLRVELGLVDENDAQPDTFGADGFADPRDLLSWLENHAPQEDLVLSHGDFCLPNIFLTDTGVSGYIDLGRCGIADKWCDIALCCRSLQNNFGGVYGTAYPDFDLQNFFDCLGIVPNPEKLRYYILLDELF